MLLLLLLLLLLQTSSIHPSQPSPPPPPPSPLSYDLELFTPGDTSRITRYTSRITRYTSRITLHTSHFTPGDAAASGPFWSGGGGVGFNGEADAAVAQQPQQPQAVRTYVTR